MKLMYTVMLIGNVFSSIRRYQYLKDENIPLKKIDSLLQLNSTNFIISNTDSLHNCNLADKFNCEEFMKTNDKKIVLRSKDNLLIMSKDNLTLLHPNSFKKQYSFDLNLGNISQGLIFENDTVISYSQNNLHKIQILTPSYKNITLINREYDQSIIQMSNGLLVAVDNMNYICVFDPKKNYKIVNKFEDENLSFELIELSNGNLISISAEDIKEWNSKQNFSLVRSVKTISQLKRPILLSDGMIIGGNGHEILILDPNQNFKNVRNLTGHMCNVDKYMQMQNGLLLTSCFDFEDVRIWNPSKNYTLVETPLFPKFTGEISLIQLSNGLLVIGSYYEGINVFDSKNNYTLIAKFGSGTVDLLELSNRLLASSQTMYGSGSIILWDPDKNFTLIKSIKHNSNKLLQLTNGMLLSSNKIGSTNIFSINTQINVTSKLTNHKKNINKIFKVDSEKLISISDDKLCLNEVNEESVFYSKCQDLTEKIQDLLVIKKNYFITSYFNGNISYWNYVYLETRFSKKISEILHIKKSDKSTPVMYASKLHKTISGDIVALIDNNMSISLKKSNLDFIFMNKNISLSSLVDIININSTDTINVYSNGIIEYYSTKIYLDPQDKNDEIQFYDFFEEDENIEDYYFEFKSLHNCPSFYDDENNPMIIENEYKGRQILSYKFLNSSCNINDKLKIVVFHYPCFIDSVFYGYSIKNYEINLERKNHSIFSLPKIRASQNNFDIFKTNPLYENILTIMFRRFEDAKILYLNEKSEWKEICFNSEYDSLTKFKLEIDFVKEANKNLFIPIILRDNFGIKSNLITLEVLILDIPIPSNSLILIWAIILLAISALSLGIYFGIKIYVKKRFNSDHLKTELTRQQNI